MPGRVGQRNSITGVRRLLIATICLAIPSTAVPRERGTPRDVSAITAIVLHSIGGPACVAGQVVFAPIPWRADDAPFWTRFLRASPAADAHYVIGRSGTVEQAMPIDQIANHAVGVNTTSIGIELVHRGDGLEPFEEAQIRAVIALIKDLRISAPGILPENVVRHADVDQQTCPCGSTSYRRRQDPGANFPFQHVKDEAFGPSAGRDRRSSLPVLTGSSASAGCVTRPR